MLKKYSNSAVVILWAQAKDRCSEVVSCCVSFVIEIIWNPQFSSKPVCSGTKGLCGAKPAAQCVWIYATTFMVLSSFLDTSIQSSWEIEQQNRCLVFWNYMRIFFQNDFELFNCGISLLFFCTGYLNLQGEILHPSTCRTEWRTLRLHGVKARLTTLETYNKSWLHSYFDCN